MLDADIGNLVQTRLALAVDAARLGSWTWDMASGVTVWDHRLEEMHGLVPGGFGGTFEDWVEALHPDDRSACIATVQQALANPGPYTLLHRTSWADGSVHTIECRGTVLVDADGTPVGTTGVAIDVTDREQLVRTLQKTLLPTSYKVPRGMTVAVRYHAADTATEIGGDWYAVVSLPGGRLGLAIGDVAGHGLGAVAHMAAARFSLRALALTDPSPDVVMGRLNDVVNLFEDDALITALYGVLDPAEHTWTYANAGHVPAVMRHPDGQTDLLDELIDPPLGVASTFRTGRVDVEPGSTLVLYTDGLIERRSDPIDDSLDRLIAACRSGPADPDALSDHLIASIVNGQPITDDAALLIVRLG